MENIALLILATFSILGIEITFFVLCFRWLSNSKRVREKDFAIMDKERSELLQLQASLGKDVLEAKTLSEETLKKLKMLGAEAHGEWVDMKNNLQNLIQEFDDASRLALDSKIEIITKHRLSLEKMITNAAQQENILNDKLLDVKRVLRFLDKSVPQEQILNDLQKDKYSEAKNLLAKGTDAQAIARKLGISINEIMLLSHMR